MFFICFKSTKEVISGGNERSVKQNPIVMICASFKNAFKDWNVAWLMIAMIIYLTGVFGRLGVMAYYFIYVLAAPMGIAAFGTAMTVGMLVVNFIHQNF